MKYDAQVEPVVEEDLICSIGPKHGVIDTPHEHDDHYQLEILFEGTAVDRATDRSGILLPFQINAIDPSMPHRVDYRHTDSIFFFVSRKLMGNYLRREGLSEKEPSFDSKKGYQLAFPQAALKSEVASLLSLHHSVVNGGSDPLLEGLIKERTYSTLNVFLSNLIPGKKGGERDYHEKVIGRVCEWINDNYWDENLTFDIMAERANLSKFHFARIFRRVTGQTPIQYLQRTRVKRASELAIKKRLSKMEIALSVGFNSVKQLNFHTRKYPL